MSFRIRPARRRRFPRLLRLAKLTGGGFTNLPADRDTLVAKLDALRKVVRARRDESQADDLYVFVLEDPETEARSAAPARCSAQVGVDQPFYSYHISTLTQNSAELGRTFRNQTLT